MSDFEKFSFVIPAYSPETMPLDRLIEYLQQIALIIGDPGNLHLVEIQKGSTAPTFLVPTRVALQARDHAIQIENGNGNKEQTRAYNRIRKMLRRDNGHLNAAAAANISAQLKSPNKLILNIPAAPDDSGILTGVRQATNIDGVLIKIGGAGDNASLQIQDMQGQIMSGFTANRTLAKEMAKLIYEPIRVSGVGLWDRSSEGVWELDKMQIQSYELLEDDSLTTIIERLRDLKVDWPEDSIDRLIEERGAAL